MVDWPVSSSVVDMKYGDQAMNDRDEIIRRRAYAIWENEGRPEGQERRHWEQAAREIGPDEVPMLRETNRNQTLPSDPTQDEARDTGDDRKPSL
ncbi:hypothetical protein ASD52_23785 [Ensifer sp. Root142]|nr:hypothetical protein ASD52_23785 [Ensifer sp. Root142]